VLSRNVPSVRAPHGAPPPEVGGSSRAPNPGPRCPQRLPTARSPAIVMTFQERTTMLLYEVLARDRMCHDQRQARQERVARRLATARRWKRLARYAERRARRAAERL
jgi:hypothetical protein